MKELISLTLYFLVSTFLTKVSAQSENNSYFIDSRDGQKYYIININDQTWMTSNLNYFTKDSYYYNNDSLTHYINGRLYNWEEAINACPEGWHLPSDKEWKTLEKNMGMKKAEINQDGYRGDSSKNMLINIGFNPELPGILKDDVYMGFGNFGFYWTASPYKNDYAWKRAFDKKLQGIGRHAFNKKFHISVRCVKN